VGIKKMKSNKMKNLQLDIDKLIKEKNDLKNELDAHLEKQLDMPTKDDFDDLENENAKLKKQVADYISFIISNY